MFQNTNSMAMFLTMLSFIFGGIGFILGVVFMMNRFDIGIMMILFTLVQSVILYSLGRLTLMIGQLKVLSRPEPTYKKEEAIEEEGKEQEEEPKEEHVTKEWVLTEEERQNIIAFYNENDQRIEEIMVTPFFKYCVVKAEDFIDVIELVNGQPVTLTKTQVEEMHGLRKWIEENIFN
ncbi:hypothetical protein LC040_00650 [Bacillus tianshenii]|nr:hypothetical protein LC040_00650 [Bacillus tianshenii]